MTGTIIAIDRRGVYYTDPMYKNCNKIKHDASPLFMDKPCKIYRQDEVSLQLLELDLCNIEFKNCLGKHESYIKVKDRHQRLKQEGCLLPDMDIARTIIRNEDCIPKTWETMRSISFDGSIFIDRAGHGYVMFIRHNGSLGFWQCGYMWVDLFWESNDFSAVLTKKSLMPSFYRY